MRKKNNWAKIFCGKMGGKMNENIILKNILLILRELFFDKKIRVEWNGWNMPLKCFVIILKFFKTRPYSLWNIFDQFIGFFD